MKGSAQRDFLRESLGSTAGANKDVLPEQESLGASLLRLVADLEIEEVSMSGNPILSHEAVASLAAGTSSTSRRPHESASHTSPGGEDYPFPSPFSHVKRAAGAGSPSPAPNEGTDVGKARGRDTAAGPAGGTEETPGRVMENVGSRGAGAVGGPLTAGGVGGRGGGGESHQHQNDLETRSVDTEGGSQGLLEEEAVEDVATRSAGHALRVAQRQPAREKLGV